MDKNEVLQTECTRQPTYAQISDFKGLDSWFFLPFRKKRALLIMYF